MFCISIVSHGHGDMSADLVNHLLTCPSVSSIILTLNVTERCDVLVSEKVTVIQNPLPQGFAANHNAAFSLCNEEYFVVLNPDVWCNVDLFLKLSQAIQEVKFGVLSPTILSSDGSLADNGRPFPSFVSLSCRFYRRLFKGVQAPLIGPRVNDWIGGMFMVFRSSTYQKLGGFDEKYRLYMEDVDICWRLNRIGMRVVVISGIYATHQGQCKSYRDMWHFFVHAQSAIRFFVKRFLYEKVIGKRARANDSLL